jgi:hypothetical protein
MKVRSLAAMLAALLVPVAATAAPAARPAAARTSTSSGMQGLSIGGFIGYETDDVSGLMLRADAELPFRALSPAVNLSWVGSLGYSRLSDDLGNDLDFTVNLIKIIPAARFSFPLTPEFSLFADGGLGLYYASWTLDTFDFFGGRREFDDSEFSLMMRFGGGGFFQVNETTRIGAMLELDPLFGDFDQTLFSIQVGAMFQL